MYWIWVLIFGAAIGIAAGIVTKHHGPMGVVSNFFAGVIGASLGQAFFDTWGPHFEGVAMVPTISGAVLLVLLVSAIFSITPDP